ncbi:MAG: DNA-3-methyladenine glycosylase I, partial [Gemmatimonadota bacterium]
MTYCEIARADALHKPYHDREYGFPSADDDVLFERLVLEINQAGLSWATILKKRDSFRRAYANFDVDRVARFNARDRARLMNNAGVIRNRLKIEAAIHNAQQIQQLRAG